MSSAANREGAAAAAASRAPGQQLLRGDGRRGAARRGLRRRAEGPAPPLPARGGKRPEPAPSPGAGTDIPVTPGPPPPGPRRPAAGCCTAEAAPPPRPPGRPSEAASGERWQAPVAQAQGSPGQSCSQHRRLRSGAGSAKSPPFPAFGAEPRVLPGPRQPFDDGVRSRRPLCRCERSSSHKNKPARDTSEKKSSSFSARERQDSLPRRSSEPARPGGPRLPNLCAEDGSSCPALRQFRAKPSFWHPASPLLPRKDRQHLD